VLKFKRKFRRQRVNNTVLKNKKTTACKRNGLGTCRTRTNHGRQKKQQTYPQTAKTVFTKLEETLPSKPSDWGKETISCGGVKRVRIFQHFKEHTILLPNVVTGH